MSFIVPTDTPSTPGETRGFTSFLAAAEENGISRIYDGYHFSFANADGIALGQNVANYAFANAFTPTPEPGSIVLLSVGLAAFGFMRPSRRVKSSIAMKLRARAAEIR